MSIHHVTFEVTREQVDAQVAFWALLGFELVETPLPLRGRAVWLRRAGSHVHLLIDEDPVVPPRAHAAFVIEDFEMTLHALRAAGHESRPAKALWPAGRVYVLAPGGHRIELMSEPPPAELTPPTRSTGIPRG